MADQKLYFNKVTEYIEKATKGVGACIDCEMNQKRSKELSMDIERMLNDMLNGRATMPPSYAYVERFCDLTYDLALILLKQSRDESRVFGFVCYLEERIELFWKCVDPGMLVDDMLERMPPETAIARARTIMFRHLKDCERLTVSKRLAENHMEFVTEIMKHMLRIKYVYVPYLTCRWSTATDITDVLVKNMSHSGHMVYSATHDIEYNGVIPSELALLCQDPELRDTASLKEYYDGADVM